MIPRGDQEQGGGVRADAVQGQQVGGAGGDERDDELIEVPDLGVGVSAWKEDAEDSRDSELGSGAEYRAGLGIAALRPY